MDKTNQTTPHEAAPDDIIELGVASKETKGGGGFPIEEFGLVTLPGISEE